MWKTYFKTNFDQNLVLAVIIRIFSEFHHQEQLIVLGNLLIQTQIFATKMRISVFSDFVWRSVGLFIGWCDVRDAILKWVKDVEVIGINSHKEVSVICLATKKHTVLADDYLRWQYTKRGRQWTQDRALMHSICLFFVCLRSFELRQKKLQFDWLDWITCKAVPDTPTYFSSLLMGVFDQHYWRKKLQSS